MVEKSSIFQLLFDNLPVYQWRNARETHTNTFNLDKTFFVQVINILAPELFFF